LPGFGDEAGMRFLGSLWVLCGCVAVSVSAADWPRFLGLRMDASSPETNLLDRIPAGGPPVLWDKAVGTGYSAPSVAGGRVFLFHRLGTEELLEAWDAATAKPLWKHSQPTRYRDPYGYNDGPRCAPLVEGGRVYTFGAEGLLTCVDAADGKQVWQRRTSEEFQVPEAFFGVGSTPVLEGGRLLVMVGGQPDSTVVAFDPKDGRTLWQSVGSRNWTGQPMLGWPGDQKVQWKPWEKTASYASLIPATVGGRRVVHAVTRQGLVVLDPADGTPLFSRWFRARVDESVNAMTPLVVGDEVLISSAYYRSGSVLLRGGAGATNFTEVWKGLGLEMHWSQPIRVGGHLYGFSGRNEPDAVLRCVEYGTGAVKWERPERWPPHSAEQPPVFGRGSLLLADGLLYALGEGGLFGIFRPGTERCEELGRWQVPTMTYPCWAGPVLSDGRLFLRNERRMVCLDLRKVTPTTKP
jgi:outer membrane protein assembly factor BamB